MKWVMVVSLAVGLACTAGCQKDPGSGETMAAADESQSGGKDPARDPGDKGKPRGSAETRTDDIKPARIGAGTPFQSVEERAALGRLGPKMRPGAKLAHHVFEGPFGPSPKSLFAVVKRKEGTFFVLVMNDDGKAWPAGPLADPELNTAAGVTAVSFFDANGDGTTDALVMATYHGPRGGQARNVNVLLEWTDQGMRRLLKLEPKIESLTTVAAVKQKLGR